MVVQRVGLRLRAVQLLRRVVRKIRLVVITKERDFELKTATVRALSNVLEMSVRKVVFP